MRPARGEQRLDGRRERRRDVEAPLLRHHRHDDVRRLHALPRQLARVDFPDDLIGRW